MKSSNIKGWVSRFQNSIYQYDFAFPDLKIDIEVDGSTHNNLKVKEIDKRRDKFSIEQGWTVLRFNASQVKNDVVSCINKIIEISGSLSG